ncbi:hypothetical protein L6164_005239 [Bauhinia variegata]|uniref:Uncharacterized protein n=1 Tax=Bauhinia variegata TaxID=167791 RepID=A0ACB9PQP3_BAUVA|nr:hypothetical protein L6164_005239 [Bauhinia variegata]
MHGKVLWIVLLLAFAGHAAPKSHRYDFALGNPYQDQEQPGLGDTDVGINGDNGNGNANLESPAQEQPGLGDTDVAINGDNGNGNVNLEGPAQEQPGLGDTDVAINSDNGNGNASASLEGPAKADFETTSIGNWDLVNQDSGVSAMQINLLPNNKIIAYDTKTYRKSRLLLPPGVTCLSFVDDKTKELINDCWAHSIEYDIQTNNVIPLKMESDPWCSAGGLATDGTLVGTGGFLDGEQTVRSIGACEGCQWQENVNGLKERRWYPTQIILPGGEFLVVGGRRAFSYEFLRLGRTDQKLSFFPFLYETTDLDENNLYPFVHLSTDGNVFVFANNRSVLLDPYANKIVRTFPVLPGGSRNYPASGMSALLPIKLTTDNSTPPAEVIVCGGNQNNAFRLAETKKEFVPALRDCNRIVITDPNPKWETEDMPSRRTMGDLLNLPTGELLFVNGAQRGTAAWWDAEEPNFTPVLYNPDKPQGERFKVMKASQIARMYHSSSALLPDGKIWVGGSNTHQTYVDNDRFPTETRIENFSPSYLDAELDKYRPAIDEAASAKILNYGQEFQTVFSINEVDGELSKSDIKVTIYPPPFTTHGYSMGQRLVILKNLNLNVETPGTYRLFSSAPPSGVIAPPGYYLLFVVHRGVPSKAMWVQIQ